jgi:hypothetical protein
MFGDSWEAISTGLCLMKDELCDKADEILEFNRHGLWDDPNIDYASNAELNIVTVKQLVHYAQILKTGRF